MPTPTPPVVAPPPTPAPKKIWPWVLLAIVVLAAIGAGVYWMSTRPQENTNAVQVVTPTVIPSPSSTPATTPEVSQSDDLPSIEKELNSTQVKDDTSGYSTVETDLKGL
jgi:hypothetical protein